jgi:hypothetical protein
VGVGLAQDQINVARFVELANVCEANGWTLGGAVYEAPGLSKWDNLKRILQAAASQPLWARGQLDIKISAPVVSLDTITADDVGEGAVEVTARKGWRDRVNTVVPRFRSEEHRWDYVQGDAIDDAGYLAEDGEVKTREVQFDLCQDKDQAAELAAYELVNGREFGPIQMTVKPRLMAYRPGEAVTLDIPEAGLNNELAIITGRSIDPGTGAISLILERETDAMHDFALGRTGTAPPTPTILSPEDIDATVSAQDPALNAANATMPEVPPTTVDADDTGTVLTGELPLEVSFKRFAGAVDVTASTAWTRTLLSGNATTTIGAADGILELTGPTNLTNSVVRVTSVYSGVELFSDYPIYKASAIASGGGSGGGSGSSDTIFNSINSTSHAAISDELEVTVGATGVVDLTAALTVKTARAAPTGTFEVLAIFKWWNGSSWADVGTEVASDPDARITHSDIYELDMGSISISTAKTGLTPAAVEKFQLYARNNSGTRIMTFVGSAGASGA